MYPIICTKAKKFNEMSEEARGRNYKNTVFFPHAGLQIHQVQTKEHHDHDCVLISDLSNEQIFLSFDLSFMFLPFSLKALDLEDISNTQGIFCRNF